MEFYITYFYNLRFLPENAICISTAMWDPSWITTKTKNGKYYYVDDRNLLIGIKEDSLIFNQNNFEKLDEQCQKNYPYIDKVPHCKFMDLYRKQLEQIDFDNYLIPEFTRIAEDVRKITHYKGEPIITLLVHEKPEVKCSERPILKEVFKKHGIELKEWQKEEQKSSYTNIDIF